jgi:hypothetical protein
MMESLPVGLRLLASGSMLATYVLVTAASTVLTETVHVALD